RPGGERDRDTRRRELGAEGDVDGAGMCRDEAARTAIGAVGVHVEGATDGGAREIDRTGATGLGVEVDDGLWPLRELAHAGCAVVPAAARPAAHVGAPEGERPDCRVVDRAAATVSPRAGGIDRTVLY